jgi:hypothetical protein
MISASRNSPVGAERQPASLLALARWHIWAPSATVIGLCAMSLLAGVELLFDVRTREGQRCT